MPKKRIWGALGLGLAGLGVYTLRRRLIGRFLGLRPVGHAFRVEHGLAIPMPDGVILRADHYVPKGSRLFPTVLIRTPYGRAFASGPSGMLASFAAARFAERGYNVIVQDVRGRYDSEGEFDPFVHEAGDGRATLAWLEKQPWFNGVVGMWGQSYVGYTQWAAAIGAPLYLKAIVPSETGASLPVSSFRDGVFAMETLFRWIHQLSLAPQQGKLPFIRSLSALSSFFDKRRLERAFAHLPLAEADVDLAGAPVPFYRRWLAHPELDDPYWRRVDFGPQAARVTAAAHLVSGWYDILLRELLADYAALARNGRQPYLTIGPWDHLSFDLAAEALRQGILWFDAHLKGDPSRLPLKPVRLYVLGAGWRELESWPPPSRSERFYLQPGESLRGVLVSAPPPDDLPPSRYIYNPVDPTPSLGGNVMSAKAGPRDNRPLERRLDVLTFSTSPLEAPLEVIGPVSLELFVRSSLQSADFIARLCDVFPDGNSINLCDGIFRLEPGRGQPQPDGSTRILIELWPTANRFAQGHALRLLISSGAHPRWSRNPGSGEPLSTAVRLQPAEQSIYHDRLHPSALILPVIEP